MKLTYCLAAALTFAHAAWADAPRVALVYSDFGNFRHRDDYDARLAGMGWPLTKFENTHFGELVAQLDDFDIVLGSALFNYSNVQDFAAHKDELLQFVRAGGAVVLTDCNYLPMVEWLGALGDGWSVSVANTQVNPCPPAWMKSDHVLFTTPNRIESLGGTWAQMQVGDAWTVLARSEEGGVTAAFRREGRGFFYITSRWPLDERMLANLWTCLQLSRAGVEMTLPDLSTFHLGRNEFTVRLRNLTEEPRRVRLDIRDEQDAKAGSEQFSTRTDVPPLSRRLLAVEMDNAYRGGHHLDATVFVDDRVALATDPVSVTIPPLLQVRVAKPAYRGTVYAAHPPRDIVLEALVTPDAGDEIGGLSLAARLAEGEPPTIVQLKEAVTRVALRLPDRLPHSLQATVALRRGDKRIASQTVTIPVIPSQPDQVFIDERCATRVAGEPFFPIGIYHANPDVFPRLHEMGFNTAVAWGTTPEGAKRGLDAAQAAGLKVVLELSSFLRGEYKPEGLGELVDGLLDHPALLAWYSVDEPAGQQLDWCRDALRLIAGRDANHPVYLVMCSPGDFARFAETTEILAIDPYPIPHAPVDMVAGWMKAAQEAVAGEKPVWLIPQCQNVVAYSDPKAGRGPTPDEERCMVYQGLIYGAKGVIYYPWDDGPCGLIHDPALMEAVTGINAQLAEIGPELLVSERRLIADSPPEHPGLRAASFVGPTHVYVIATNTGKEEVAASSPFPGAIGDQVDVLFEGRTVRTKDGVLTDRLAPLSVHVYRTDTP
jgi:hypothetical protein